MKYSGKRGAVWWSWVFYLSVTLCSKQNSTHVWKRELTDHSLSKNIKVFDCKHLLEITPKKSAHRNYPINMTQNINGMEWNIPYKYVYFYYKLIIFHSAMVYYIYFYNYVSGNSMCSYQIYRKLSRILKLIFVNLFQANFETNFALKIGGWYNFCHSLSSHFSNKLCPENRGWYNFCHSLSSHFWNKLCPENRGWYDFWHPFF